MRTNQWIVRGFLSVVVGWGFAIGSTSSAETGKGATSGAGDVSSKTTDPASVKTATPPAPAPQAPPTPSEPAAPPAVAPPPTKPISQNDEVRARLTGTSWSLELVSLSQNEKGKIQKDTVTFEAHTVSSDRLSKAGFPTSNYSLNIGEDGVAVWETMQAHSEGKGVAFWRGEIHGDTMEGVLSNQPTGGSPEEFSFTGHQIGGAAVSSAVAQTTAAPRAEPLTTSIAEKALTQPASTKKKKR